MISRDQLNFIEYLGTYNFDFELTTSDVNVFSLTSNLIVNAKDPETGLHIPVKC